MAGSLHRSQVEAWALDTTGTGANIQVCLKGQDMHYYTVCALTAGFDVGSPQLFDVQICIVFNRIKKISANQSNQGYFLTFKACVCVGSWLCKASVKLELVYATPRTKGAQLFRDLESIWHPQMNKSVITRIRHTHPHWPDINSNVSYFLWVTEAVAIQCLNTTYSAGGCAAPETQSYSNNMQKLKHTVTV